MDLTPHQATLRQLTRTDPDPRVRHRAAGLLRVAGGLSVSVAAQRLGCSRTSLQSWSRRFLAAGRTGLADRARRGRPPKLDAAARALREEALAASPLTYAYPVTTWTIADLTDLLRRQGWCVCPATVWRTGRERG